MMFITLDHKWNHKLLNMSIIPGSVALCWDWMWTSIAYSSKVGNEVLMSSDIWTFGVDLRFHKCHRYLPTSDIIANTAPFPRNSRKDCGRDDMDVTFVTQRKGIGLPTLLTFAWRLHESWGNLRMLMTDDRWLTFEDSEDIDLHRLCKEWFEITTSEVRISMQRNHARNESEDFSWTASCNLSIFCEVCASTFKWTCSGGPRWWGWK